MDDVRLRRLHRFDVGDGLTFRQAQRDPVDEGGERRGVDVTHCRDHQVRPGQQKSSRRLDVVGRDGIERREPRLGVRHQPVIAIEGSRELLRDLAGRAAQHGFIVAAEVRLADGERRSVEARAREGEFQEPERLFAMLHDGGEGHIDRVAARTGRELDGHAVPLLEEGHAVHVARPLVEGVGHQRCDAGLVARLLHVAALEGKTEREGRRLALHEPDRHAARALERLDGFGTRGQAGAQGQGADGSEHKRTQCHGMNS